MQIAEYPLNGIHPSIYAHDPCYLFKMCTLRLQRLLNLIRSVFTAATRGKPDETFKGALNKLTLPPTPI